MILPYWQNNRIQLYNSDCRHMTEVPDNSGHCIVTSPPYWGLRRYSGLPDKIGGNNGSSWKGQFGLEPTIELYIQHTFEILAECKRVLRKDGVCFWNIGDSYTGGGNNRSNHSLISQKQASNAGAIRQCADHQKNIRLSGLKPKDLCLIPFRAAIAAQEQGWWVRSVIIWLKNNPMPESVRDRPTESHEYILMLTKSAKYYWDQEAVREKTGNESTWEEYANGDGHHSPSGTLEEGKSAGFGSKHDSFTHPNGRNLRSVWSFPTQPYKEAHFATYPEELPKRCIKAATSEYGVCSKCGAPWERIVEKGLTIHDGHTEGGKEDNSKRLSIMRQAARERGAEYRNEQKTLGWHPTCKCDAERVPATVLDPFAGSGTTLYVATKLGRRAVGYELSEPYYKLIIDRCRPEVFL